MLLSKNLLRGPFSNKEEGDIIGNLHAVGADPCSEPDQSTHVTADTRGR